MKKLPILNDQEWEAQQKRAAHRAPLKTMRALPQMPDITKQTVQGLKRKTLLYMIKEDASGAFAKYFLKKPFRNSWLLLKSFFKKKTYTRDEDFYFYGLGSAQELKEWKEQKPSLLVVGFSYCHKPFECPSGRFTKECIHDADHPVCQQCFISRAMSAAKIKNAHTLVIITIHHIAEELIALRERFPDHRLAFIITACHMTLEMGGLFPTLLPAKGIGVRLSGRICNTMRAFELSEKGIKPGLTVVADKTQKRILELLAEL